MADFSGYNVKRMITRRNLEKNKGTPTFLKATVLKMERRNTELHCKKKKNCNLTDIMLQKSVFAKILSSDCVEKDVNQNN